MDIKVATKHDNVGGCLAVAAADPLKRLLQLLVADVVLEGPMGQVDVDHPHPPHSGDETLQWIADRDREAPADVIVLGGDFNIQPGWSEMSLLTDSPGPGELRYLDLNSSDPTRGRPGAPRARVDYIFVAVPDRDLRMLGERLLYKDGLLTGDDGDRRFWLSDHVPLLHEYAIDTRRLAATSVQ